MKTVKLIIPEVVSIVYGDICTLIITRLLLGDNHSAMCEKDQGQRHFQAKTNMYVMTQQ